MITVFEVPGTGGAFQFQNSFDSTKVKWVGVTYPAQTYPMNTSVNEGIVNLTAAVNATQPGDKFAFIGVSQGAIVTSNVYDALRTGSLQSRRADLVGAVTLGNPRRQEGHTFPNCPDPGGHGLIASDLLTETETLWWDIAVPGDDIACDPDTPAGQLLSAAIYFLMNNYTSFWSLWPLFFSASGIELMQAIEDVITTLYYHLTGYSSYQPLADGRSCTKVAIDYINSLA